METDEGFLDRHLPAGKEQVRWSLTSLVLVIARLLEPSSELYISEQWYPKTALPELVGVPQDRMDDNRLYRALDELLPHTESLEKRYGKSDRIWIMDRGMTSEVNLSLLREGQRRYIIGTPKSMLKKFEQEVLKKDWHIIRDGIEVKICKRPLQDDEPTAAEQNEVFILCRGRDRKAKDEAIVNRAATKIQERIEAVQSRCEKLGLKLPTKIISEQM